MSLVCYYRQWSDDSNTRVSFMRHCFRSRKGRRDQILSACLVYSWEILGCFFFTHRKSARGCKTASFNNPFSVQEHGLTSCSLACICPTISKWPWQINNSTLSTFILPTQWNTCQISQPIVGSQLIWRCQSCSNLCCHHFVHSATRNLFIMNICTYNLIEFFNRSWLNCSIKIFLLEISKNQYTFDCTHWAEQYVLSKSWISQEKKEMKKMKNHDKYNSYLVTRTNSSETKDADS